jgi:hypothetical protein
MKQEKKDEEEKGKETKATAKYLFVLHNFFYSR